MDYGSTVTTELDGETPVGKPLALKSAAERARCLLRAGQPRAATRASTASWRRDRDARCAPRTPPGSPSPAPAGRRFLRPAPRAAVPHARRRVSSSWSSGVDVSSTGMSRAYAGEAPTVLGRSKRWLTELARAGRLAGAAKHGNTRYIPEEEVAGSVGRYTRRLAPVLRGSRTQRQAPSSDQDETAAANLLRESSRPSRGTRGKVTFSRIALSVTLLQS